MKKFYPTTKVNIIEIKEQGNVDIDNFLSQELLGKSLNKLNTTTLEINYQFRSELSPL